MVSGKTMDRGWLKVVQSATGAVSLTASRMGLISSNSSTTYPHIVPSENVTISPSSPSYSALRMCISPDMLESLSQFHAGVCSMLVIPKRNLGETGG